MDIRTRQGLLNALVGKVGKRMDTLLIPLELLCCISRTEFSDKKAYIRWQKRQVSAVSFLVFFFWLWTAGNICQLSFLNVFSCVRTVEHVGGGPYKSPCCWIWGIWAQGKWIADSSSKNWRIWGMCFIGLHDLLWYFTYLLHCPSLYIAVVVVFDLIVETIPPYIIVLDSGFAVVFIVQTRCPIFLMRCCLSYFHPSWGWFGCEWFPLFWWLLGKRKKIMMEGRRRDF